MSEPAALTVDTATGPVSALWQSPAGARAALLLAHGAGAGMAHRTMATIADGLAARGVATLRFQFPFMERGSRRPDSPAVAQEALRAAFDVLVRRAGGLPLFAGGRSFGGRMASQAQAAAALPGARGLVFFAFPLHPAGKPSVARADHLRAVAIPMLFLQGTRDALADLDRLRPVVEALGTRARLELASDADHAFHVPARSGRTDAAVLGDLLGQGGSLDDLIGRQARRRRMTTASEGAELTRVGPGTPMGQVMRQYWLPALYASELERDGPPVRLMLLGEKLIAFRDSDGRVGVMDHRCPHRCASLFLGRNEAGGLRCVYHGWKFAADGRCIDMPSVPAEQDFKHKVRARAYRTAERAGLVWVYLGERAEAPPLPGFEVLDLPADEIKVSLIQRDCNWLQALEGEIDTAHFGFLHGGHADPRDVPESDPFYFTITNRAPQYHVADTAWGTQYAGYRAAGPGRTYWRFANFLFPCWSQAPNGEFASHMHARAWVPLDDHHTMFVFIWWKRAASAMSLPQPTFRDGRPIGGTGRGGLRFLPNSSDWLGRWRMADNQANDWGLDRDAQRRNAIYSGIDGIHLQDQAVTESMGPVTDFAFEHLGPSDQMITRTRRRLLRAARALRDAGTAPPGAEQPEVYRAARSGYFVAADEGRPWREVYAGSLAQALHPPAQA